VEAEVSPCPIAAATMGVMNLLDVVGERLDNSLYSKVQEGIDSRLKRFQDVERTPDGMLRWTRKFTIGSSRRL